ncbi:hypothetical protein NMG60_11035216 [Bertholletia excelsa]
MLDISCQDTHSAIEKPKILSPGLMRKPLIVGSQQNSDTQITSVTPEKTNESIHKRNREKVAELPEKYRIISEYFDRMICSLRLLALKHKLPTFQNISRQVEILMGRKFSYMHLAQIKYLLPEVVQTVKILVCDEKTLCMQPEIKITLLFDIVDDCHEQSVYVALRQVFVSRLLQFSSMHTEGSDIPEAKLPEPFNNRSETIIRDEQSVYLTASSQERITESELLPNQSNLYPSPGRHFSEKFVTETHQKAQASASSIPLSFAEYQCMTDQHIGVREQKVIADTCPEATVITDPVQHSSCSDSSAERETTPLKLAPETENLTVQTPFQLTPKRSIPSCDNKLKTMTSQKGPASNISAKRSLDFSLMEGEQSAFKSIMDEVDGSEFAPNSTPPTLETKGKFVKESVTCSSLLQEEGDSCIGKDQTMNQTKLVLHKQVSDLLPELVLLIHQIFKSANWSSITKNELVHKIIWHKFDIVERREVEEQIEALEKMIPDWICRKVAPSGDIIYSIKRMADIKSVKGLLASEKATQGS